MRFRSQPADEPYESRDLELGSVIRSWADMRTSAAELTLDGPLDAPGMDPTWILEVRGKAAEAFVNLLYGPVLDVTVVRLSDDEVYIGGAQDFSGSQLAGMLDDLLAASDGGVIPPWLRAMPNVGQIETPQMLIREADARDMPFLERVLLAAYNWSEERFTLDWIRTDEMARRYLDGFPGEGDLGLIALIDSVPVGAVWGRALPAERAGYGFVAPDVPELTLGVVPDARGRGVASSLMTAVVDLARQRRIPGLSLSVEDGNTARRLYERCGFTVVGRNGGSDTMLLDTSAR